MFFWNRVLPQIIEHPPEDAIVSEIPAMFFSLVQAELKRIQGIRLPETRISWIGEKEVLCSNVNYWMRCPWSRIDRIKIGPVDIRLCIGALELVFVREGFENEECWKRVCQIAMKASK